MSDVFISYAREDCELVSSLASALRTRGWSVWWDSAIRTGEKFSQVIEAALGSARCVIVVWSQHSVISDWVLAEASEARRHGKLVPIVIDDVRSPLVFRQLQTADFAGWEGTVESPQFEQLAHDIANLIAVQPGLEDRITNELSPPPKTGAGRHLVPGQRVLWAMLVLALIGGATGGLIYQQQQERAEIALVTDLVRGAIETRQQLLKRYVEGHDYWWYLLEDKGGEKLLQRSVLLAVEAMRRRPSADGEKALRDGLVLLTRPIMEMDYEGYSSSALAMSPDGKYLAAANRKDTACIWETTNWQEIQRLRHESEVRAVAFSPDGQTLATGSGDGTVRLWNVSSGEERSRMAKMKSVWDLDFSPDGSRLVGAGFDGYAHIWDVTDGQEVQRMKHPLPRVERVVFSPSGRHLVTVDGDAYSGVEKESTVRLWDTKSAALIATFGQGKAADVAFSPDGKYLATAPASYNDSSAHLWDMSTMKEVRHMEHDGGALESVAFSPDGKYLVSTGTDRTARLWALPGGDELFHVYHQERVITATFSVDGAYLVTGSQDGTARVWTVPGGEELARLNNSGNITAVLFSPDGEYVVAASDNGRARIWALPINDPLAEACQRITRNLSMEEWRQYLGEEHYRKTCPERP